MRAHTLQLLPSPAQVLFPMWARRRADKRMPPADGKRRWDRGESGRAPAQRIRYTPRPHLTIHIQHIEIEALLDTGSEASFINADIAHKSQIGFPTTATDGKVQLADGTLTPTQGNVTCPIHIGEHTLRHTFQVIPTLDSAMLIGVDLWARTRITIAPPPRNRHRPQRVKEPTVGLAAGAGTEEQRLREFLDTELELFRDVHGPTDKIEHVIRVKESRPIKQRYRPRNPAMQAIIDDEVEKMTQEKIIEPSHSAWSSPVVIVKKKDGKPRFCIDFRRVNQVTEPDAYPLPQITATLDKLRGARYLTTLDLKNGYWQIPLSPESRPITAFTVPGKGLMQFRVMPFGLYSAPATFQRLLDAILGPELEPHVFVFRRHHNLYRHI